MQEINIEYQGEEDFFYLWLGNERHDVDWVDLLKIRDKVNKLEKELNE